MQDSINLIHITDFHLALPERVMEPTGVSPESSLKRVIKCFRPEQYDAVICTGDLVHTPTTETYKHLYSILGQLGSPVLCLPGNHDSPPIATHAAEGTAIQWPPFILMGNWIIVLLNTYLPGAEQGFLGAEELKTLDQLLTAHPHKHALVCMHHHPIELGSRWIDYLMLQDDQAFLEVVEKHQNVRGILWGHVHQEHDSEHKGIRMLSTPSTCRQFKPLANTFEIDHKPPAYRRLALTKTGSITTKVIYCHQSP